MKWLLELFRADPAAADRAFKEAELSHDEIRMKLRDALKAVISPGPSTYIWPKDVYDDRVIYEVESPTGTRLYQRGYSATADGKITLGVDVAEVQARTVYQAVGEQPPTPQPAPQPTSESSAAGDALTEAVIVGDVIPLVERSVRRDGTVPVKVIKPGWGSSGYYDAAVLERDGAAAFPKGTKMFWNHPTATEEADRPERDLRDLAAETVSDARYDKNGPAGPGLYADAKVFGTYAESVEELAPHIGVSIRTQGTAKAGTVDGKSGPVVESLLPASAATSIDFVTTPGAGGQVLQLFEAARGGRVTPTPQPTQEDTPVSDELSESVRQRLEAQDTEIARLREGALFREARDVATAVLGPIDLPDVTRARLVESLAKNPPVTEAKALDTEAFKTRIDESVKAEIEYLARAAGIGDGQVRGMGGGSPEPIAEADLEKELSSAFGGLGLSESAAAIAAGGREH